MLVNVSCGSKCEELNVSKSGPLYPTDRTSTRRADTSRMGHIAHHLWVKNGTKRKPEMKKCKYPQRAPSPVPRARGPLQRTRRPIAEGPPSGVSRTIVRACLRAHVCLTPNSGARADNPGPPLGGQKLLGQPRFTKA